MKLERATNYLVKAISTGFFVGYLPFIPGTFGSLIAVWLFYLISGSSWIIHILLIGEIIALGLMTSARMERILNKKDPGCIVIDEVAGMLLALMFVPCNFRVVFLAFIIFRILDTLKPYPASRLQNRHGAIGVMGDDLVAGIYTNIVMQVILKLAF